LVAQPFPSQAPTLKSTSIPDPAVGTPLLCCTFCSTQQSSPKILKTTNQTKTQQIQNNPIEQVQPITRTLLHSDPKHTQKKNPKGGKTKDPSATKEETTGLHTDYTQPPSLPWRRIKPNHKQTNTLTEKKFGALDRSGWLLYDGVGNPIAMRSRDWRKTAMTRAGCCRCALCFWQRASCNQSAQLFFPCDVRPVVRPVRHSCGGRCRQVGWMCNLGAIQFWTLSPHPLNLA